MKNSKINVDVDEFTLVLQVNKEYFNENSDIREWPSIAKEALNTFIKNINLKNMFGGELPIEVCPKGYTHGFKYGQHSYYFAMAYHDSMPNMGIICKFSAHAWHAYREIYEDKYNDAINIYQFLHKASDTMYSLRLSRIDFYADYINYDFTVHNLYSDLTREPQSIVLKDKNGRSNYTQLSALEKNLQVQTFYVGSKLGNSNSMLRVYDKKLEQSERFGFRLDEAKSYDTWVRFEVVFKNTFAHQLTDILRENINNDEDLQSLIAGKILEKFTFYEINTNEVFYLSKDLNKVKSNEFIALKSPSTKDNDLNKSINYLTTLSGLNTTVYKIEQIWGEDTIPDFFDYLLDNYKKTYYPNDNVLSWLRKHENEMKDYDFKQYLKS